MKGALHAKGSFVSTPVGSTTYSRPLVPRTISTLQGGKSVSSSTPRDRSCLISSSASSGKSSASDRAIKSASSAAPAKMVHSLFGTGPASTVAQWISRSSILRFRMCLKNRRESGLSIHSSKLFLISNSHLCPRSGTWISVGHWSCGGDSSHLGSVNLLRSKQTESVGVKTLTRSPKLKTLLNPIPLNPMVCRALLFENPKRHNEV